MMPVDGDIPVLFGLHLRYLADGWGDVWNLAPILERRFCCLHCIAAVFHSSTGLYGSGLCIVALAALMFGVLEENRIARLGDVTGREVDFRLITATNRDLQDMIRQESFREDLYYRISTLTIRLPPLRARTEDILPLARQILSKIGCATADFTDEAVRALEAYSWPGNVRQLFNSLVHATLHQKGDRIDAADLPAEIMGGGRIPDRHSPRQRHHTLAAWLNAQEAGFLAAALQENQGNVTATARQLGISRVTLYAKLKKYGIPQLAVDTNTAAL